MTQLSAAPASPSVLKWTPPVRPDTDHLPLLDTATLSSNTFWTVLGRALTLRRDNESRTEAAYVGWLANRLPITLIDAAGNLHVDTRTLPEHRSMFTSHTDTVHHGGGVNEVRVDGKFWRASKGHALGADDGVGNALMCYMIEMGVPGYYVFFRGEERGGVGSSWLSKEMPDLFADIDRAVAFDRAGYADVITHQSGGRCCSDEFAQALANELSTDTDWYMPCSGGVYTDTAEFIRLIPECTNISVGYKNQHGDCEEQDVEFAWELAKRVVAVQWDKLPTKRDPKFREPSRYTSYSSGRSFGHMSMDSGYVWGDDDIMGVRPRSALDLYADDEDEVTGDVLWLSVYDAILAARQGSFLLLRGLIAEVVYPEDPSQAERNMNITRLSEIHLDDALIRLDDGEDPEYILLGLYEVCELT